MNASLCAVVVHHRNYPKVLRTLRHLLDQGIAPENVILVDNSNDETIARQLRDNLPDRMRMLSVENRGYAAAVNAGLRETGWLSPGNLIMVATHEIVPEPGCVARLVAEIKRVDDIAVVGPTLFTTRDGSTKVWSQGGRLSRCTGVPYHVRGDLAESEFGTRRSEDRDWLDGAFTIYRAEALTSCPLDESYFLYYEETDCHFRLRDMGWRVVWVPEAKAHQESNGIPPYLHGRNLTRFLKRYRPQVLWTLGIVLTGARTFLREVFARADRGSFRDYVKGVKEGLREVA